MSSADLARPDSADDAGAAAGADQAAGGGANNNGRNMRVSVSSHSVVQQARLMDSAGTAWHAVKYGNLEVREGGRRGGGERAGGGRRAQGAAVPCERSGARAFGRVVHEGAERDQSLALPCSPKPFRAPATHLRPSPAASRCSCRPDCQGDAVACIDPRRKEKRARMTKSARPSHPPPAPHHAAHPALLSPPQPPNR
jgi:hypothetical protein